MPSGRRRLSRPRSRRFPGSPGDARESEVCRPRPGCGDSSEEAFLRSNPWRGPSCPADPLIQAARDPPPRFGPEHDNPRLTAPPSPFHGTERRALGRRPHVFLKWDVEIVGWLAPGLTAIRLAAWAVSRGISTRPGPSTISRGGVKSIPAQPASSVPMLTLISSALSRKPSLFDADLDQPQQRLPQGLNGISVDRGPSPCRSWTRIP